MTSISDAVIIVNELVRDLANAAAEDGEVKIQIDFDGVLKKLGVG